MAELTLTTNADRLVRKSFTEGREQGQRDVLLRLLSRRFGPLPDATQQRVQALSSPEELSELAERVLDAKSLDDLGL